MDDIAFTTFVRYIHLMDVLAVGGWVVWAIRMERAMSNLNLEVIFDREPFRNIPKNPEEL